MSHIQVSSRKGFTLIELVIVIAILGVLVAISITTFSNMTVKSRSTADSYVSKKIEHAIAMYRFESNDMNLSRITHATAAELIQNLQNTTTITANTEGDKVGEYGSYLEQGVTIAPQNTSNSSFIININTTSNVITVNVGNESTTCTVEP